MSKTKRLKHDNIFNMNPQMARLYEAALALKGIASQSDLARFLGSTPQTIHNWEQRGISKQGLLLVERLVGCSALWVESGVDAMTLREKPNVAEATLGERRIPVFSYNQAGDWVTLMDQIVKGFNAEFIFTNQNISPKAFAVRLEGDSMLPEFAAGDIVVIDPEIAPTPGDFVVAKIEGKEVVFKKYKTRGVDRHGIMIFELAPLNNDFATIRSDQVQAMIIGTMVEHRRYRKR